jgi:hypothetical protein
MSGLDELDQHLVDAYRTRSERMEAVPLTPPPFVPPTRQSYRGPSLAAVVIVVLALGLVALVLARQETDDAPLVGTSPVEETTDGPMPVPPWWGFDLRPDSEVTLRSAGRADGPAWEGVRFVAELRRNGDWRSRPALSVTLVDLPAGTTTPGSVLSLGGRAATRVPSVTKVTDTRVDLGGGQGLVVRALDVDDATLAAVVDAIRISGDTMSFGALPAGLQVMSASTVDRAPYHEMTVQYDVVAASNGQQGVGLMVRAMDEPMHVALLSLMAIGDTDERDVTNLTVAGHPAIRLEGPGDFVQWRVGPILYTLGYARVIGSGAELARAMSTLHALTPAEVEQMAITTVTVPAWEGPESKPTGPVDPSAQRRIDRFLAEIPPGFEQDTAVPVHPNVSGYGVAAVNTANAKISLGLVRSTVGPPVGDTSMRTWRDGAGTPRLEWRAPSGWTYTLSAGGANPALTEQQQRDLLQRIDQS